LIDEKVRGVNKITGKVYEDIALEYLSDALRGVPGWVCKPLLADFVAYAIAPLGDAYLLPVPAMQRAWREHNEQWFRCPECRDITAHNHDKQSGRTWRTKSLCVPAGALFAAIASAFKAEFAPTAYEEGVAGDA